MYPFVWYYKINKELRNFDPSIEVKPGISLLASSLGAVLLLPPIISWAHTTSRVKQAQKLAGGNAGCSMLLSFLISFLGFGSVYIQSELNKVWRQQTTPS